MNVSVTSSVMIADGPVFSLAMDLAPESYTVAAVTLDAGTTRIVALTPESAVPILLAVRATTESGNTPHVTIQPNPGSGSGTPALELTVDSVLLICGAEVLQSVGTPRSLGVKNLGSEPVTVDILACLDLPKKPEPLHKDPSNPPTAQS
ncbi:hypothetical protein [Streptomyces sp. NPDC058622]|uniref:hypothetical protein n=1 Tax=Streptomyces sp. NPDC058622 TaxID=3346562 RepID=UPI00364BBF45